MGYNRDEAELAVTILEALKGQAWLKHWTYQEDNRMILNTTWAKEYEVTVRRISS